MIPVKMSKLQACYATLNCRRQTSPLPSTFWRTSLTVRCSVGILSPLPQTSSLWSWQGRTPEASRSNLTTESHWQTRSTQPQIPRYGPEFGYMSGWNTVFGLMAGAKASADRFIVILSYIVSFNYLAEHLGFHFQNPFFNTMLRMIATRCMMQVWPLTQLFFVSFFVKMVVIM